jgi:hypothetical protein
MSITVHNIHKGKILLEDKPLAAPGGEGSVHRIISNSSSNLFCVKLYHKHKRTPQKKSKVAFMIKNKPANLSTPNYIICWPTEMIYDSWGNFWGFVMPVAFAGSIKLYELATAKLSLKFFAQWNKFERTKKDGIERRLKVCVNISIALHSIHASDKYSLIDYKPQNILITNEGKISITDVDSFQISENKKVLYHAEVATPEYTPPEGAHLNPSNHFIPESWDRFSIAVSFYEILLGIHPFVATCGGQYFNVTTIGEKIRKGLFVHGSKRSYLTVIPPLHSNFNILPISIKNLFIKAFEDGHSNANARPQAHHWGQTIVTELNAGTSITPNLISITKQVPKATGSTIKNLITTPQSNRTIRTISPSKTKHSKKEDFMIWKIFTAILVIVAIFLFSKSQNVDKQLASLKLTSASYESERQSLQNQLLQLQNNQSSNESYYTTRISELEAGIQELSAKYPIVLISISFNNVNTNSEVLKTESYSFKKSEVKYIQPVIKYNSNLKTSSDLNLYYKIYDPNGKLQASSTSPTGYTWYGTVTISGGLLKDNIAALNAFGLSSDCPYYCITGRHKVEIWCNDVMLGEGYFELTDIN